MNINTANRMRKFIIANIAKERFIYFENDSADQKSDLVIRTIKEDGTAQYTEIQILSRSEEYHIDLQVPTKQDQENVFYYFILFSAGIGKYWVLRSDELIALRDIGLDTRESSPYLVSNYDRLKTPHLSLEEYKNK